MWTAALAEPSSAVAAITELPFMFLVVLREWVECEVCRLLVVKAPMYVRSMEASGWVMCYIRQPNGVTSLYWRQDLHKTRETLYAITLNW